MVTCNDWQLAAFSEVSEAFLPGIDQWPDDLQVSLLVLVGRLHGPQPAIVEDGHEEALSQVVQVLAKGKHIVAFSTSSSINPTALHTGAKCTDRGTVAFQCLSIV